MAVIERRFRNAAGWCLSGALLAGLGLVHSYRFTPGDTAVSLTPAWSWALGYGLMAALFWIAPWVTEEDSGP